MALLLTAVAMAYMPVVHLEYVDWKMWLEARYYCSYVHTHVITYSALPDANRSRADIL
jgi:hypothetical protein